MTHPWYGVHRCDPPGSAERILEVSRTEMRDIGWPFQAYQPAAPFVLPHASYAELFRVTAILGDLLRRTVLEVAPSPEGRAEAFGATGRDYPLFIDDQVLEERYSNSMIRPDVIIGPTGPKFVEFNISGGFGGPVEAHCRYQAWHKLYRQSAGKPPFAHHDPIAARADFFADVCEELALPPRLAWAGSVRENVEYPDSSRYFDLDVDHLTKRGFTARYFEPEDLDEAWDCAPHLRYPLGLRHINVADWEFLGIDLAPVRRALDNGVLLLSTQLSGLLSNKLTMGMLSEGRPWMSSAERDLVDRYVPWTRTLSERRTRHGDDEVDLVPHVLRERERMVLKRGIGNNGKQVLIGKAAEPTEWEHAVGEAVGNGLSVVQEHVPTEKYPLPILGGATDEPEIVGVAPVFGPFLFGGRPGGMWARYFPNGTTGIVTVARAASDNVVVVA